MHRPLISCFLVILLLPLHGADARAKERPHLKQGIRLLDEMEDARALEAFDRALASPENTARDRALIFFYIGVAHSNRFNEQAAEAHFRRALTEDAAFQPPEMIAPKIKTRFEQIRAAFLAEKARQAPKKKPEEEKAQQTERSRVDRREAEPTVAPITVRDSKEPGPASKAINWPAWITLGAAAAAGVAGTVLAVQFSEENNKASDMSLRYHEAMIHHDRAKSRGLAASILFAAAGAAAITSGVLFYLKWRTRERAVAAVAPLRSGAMVHYMATWE
jgi:hypothetical protein